MINYKSLCEKVFNVNVLVFTLFSCAQIIHPEGGIKDVEPPVLVSSSIKNGDTKVSIKTRKIEFTFNKRVRCSGRVGITPSFNNNEDSGFEVFTKGKKVTVEFTCPLKEDTTYTINFGNSITDTTEFNVAKNITLSFSTGESIDEMELSGAVYDYFSKQLVKDATVVLYEITEDKPFSIFNEPDYSIGTDEKGKYRFTNIKRGKYRIVAYLSSKKLTRIDIKSDKYGSILENIALFEKETAEYNIPILNSDITPLKIDSQKSRNKDYSIRFNKPIALFETNLDSSLGQVSLSPDGYELYVFSNLNFQDFSIEHEIDINIFDYDGNEFSEKVTVALHKYSGEPIASGFQLQKKNRLEFPATGSFAIVSDKPIDFKKLNLDYAYIKIGDKNLEISQNNVSMASENTLLINYDLRDSIDKNGDSTLCELILLESSIYDMSGKTNREIKKVFSVKHPEKVASISGNVNVTAEGHTVQLLNENNDVLDEIRNVSSMEGSYTFYGLLPGKYKIRVLLHQRNKYFWCTGNIEKNIPPDEFLEFNSEIELLENWHIRNIDFFEV